MDIGLAAARARAQEESRPHAAAARRDANAPQAVEKKTRRMSGVDVFIFAAVGMTCFRYNDPQHFHSVSAAMMSVWQIETLDEWEELMQTNMYGCDASRGKDIASQQLYK